MRPLLYSIVLLLLSFVSQAQHQYNIEYITTENGLPSDGIKGLEIDEKMGFLWIATEAGLVRYNGHQFTTISSDNFPYIKLDRIWPIVKNPDGEIYGLARKVVYKVTNNILTPVLQDDNHNTDLINIYLKDGPTKGTDLGINDFDRYLPVNKNLCYVHRADTLWEFRSGTTSKKLVLNSVNRNYTFVSNKSLLSCDNNNNFYFFDSVQNTFKALSVKANEDWEAWKKSGKKHFYWQAGMNGLIALSGTNAWLVSCNNNNIAIDLICTEIPQNSNIKLVRYWAQADVLFLGTTSKGLIILRKNHLVNIKKTNSGFDEPNAIYSQILLPDGNILTNTGDVLGNNKSSVRYQPIKHPFNNNIYLDKDSLLWYSFRDSLYYYDYKSKKEVYLHDLPGSYVIGFCESQGQTYMANYKGIYSVSENGVDTECVYQGIGDPFNIVELKPGSLAIAASRGLFVYHTANKTIDTVILTASPARSIWKYKDYLLIGTYGDGIYIYKNGVAKKIPLDNNRYLAYTHCFILDNKGFCWMSTNRGLFKASLNDLIDAYEKETEYIYYHFFGRNEGMDITEMNGGCTPCAIWLANKMISFPTMDGALWVDPQIPLRLPDTNIFIDQVVVNGHRLDSFTSDNFYFDSRTSDISFSLGFSAWCDKENIYLQYSLDTNKDKWQKIDALHPVIRLNNLPSGIYTLTIRKITGFGSNNFVTKKYTFEIQAPWYMRWWGQSLLLFLFAGIVTIAAILANRSSIRRQIRLRSQLDKKTAEILKQNEQLEKNDRIKTRLISIISHDIITPLKFLHMTSKYLSERKSSMSESMQNETLEEVVNTSRELELLSTHILNWIKYQDEERRIVKENINLHEMAEQVFTILKSLAHKNDTELVNNIAPDMTVTQFADPLKVIIYNLVVNAINFTKHGSITINCSAPEQFVQITVTDTGLGMTQTQVNNLRSDTVIVSGTNVNKRSGHGLGFLIIKDLLKMISGEFEIESKVKAGTTVTITFPAK